MTKKHEPTEESRKYVESLSAYGIPQDEICKVVGCNDKTLRLHYRAELDTACSKANAKVAGALYRKAIGDGSQSVSAAIFWLKTRARWTETEHIHHTEGGEPSAVIRQIVDNKRDEG